MLKQNPRKKSTVQPPAKKSIPKKNSENSQPTCFNTKGYFTSEEPYSEDYMKAKQHVFEKYRNKDNELVFIDPLLKPSPFIQRGMLKPANRQSNEDPHNEKVLNNFLKTYMNRKEKKEQIEEEKYFGKKRDSLGSSNVEFNPSFCTTTKGSRINSKSVYSRVSTTRSVCSNKEN